jgi:hypothetical protein
VWSLSLLAEVLARFEADLAYLAATELHPSLRGAEGSASAAASPTSLLHLVSAQQLREAAASCARGHQHFGAKVAELEGLFGMLKADVEALFMQVGCVLPALVLGLVRLGAGVSSIGGWGVFVCVLMLVYVGAGTSLDAATGCGPTRGAVRGSRSSWCVGLAHMGVDGVGSGDCC